MSWLFSRALVEEYSEGICSDGAQSAPSEQMPTPHKFWRNDKTMDASKLSQFGLTCAVLTADHGEALLASYLAASHARTSQHPAPGSALRDLNQASGNKWLESSARFDLRSSVWRTHRCLFSVALPWYSVTLPKWGMTHSGYVFQHPSLERLTSEIAPGWSGETLPTPSVAMTKGSSANSLTRKDGRSRLRNRLDYWVERDGRHGRLNPTFVEWVMGWPIGWTEIKPLEMDRFQEWMQQHSPCLPPGFKEAA